MQIAYHTAKTMLKYANSDETVFPYRVRPRKQEIQDVENKCLINQRLLTMIQFILVRK